MRVHKGGNNRLALIQNESRMSRLREAECLILAKPKLGAFLIAFLRRENNYCVLRDKTTPPAPLTRSTTTRNKRKRKKGFSSSHIFVFIIKTIPALFTMGSFIGLIAEMAVLAGCAAAGKQLLVSSSSCPCSILHSVLSFFSNTRFLTDIILSHSRHQLLAHL